jgi:hypothetical protein
MYYLRRLFASFCLNQHQIIPNQKLRKRHDWTSPELQLISSFEPLCKISPTLNYFATLNIGVIYANKNNNLDHQTC